MDRLSQMEMFVAVIENKGFAAAARSLGVSPPAVTRGINALEENLGVQLIQRTTRSIRVTELGQQYLNACRQVIETVNDANERVTGLLFEPRGHLTITAPVMFGRIYVMPVITKFLRKFPEVNISARFLDRVVDLLGEGIDLAIRIGPLSDSSYRAKRIGESYIVACANKQYLKRHGEPKSPDELGAHTLITSTAGESTRAWDFGRKYSRHKLHSRVRLDVSTNDAAISAALAGLGITRVLSYQVADELRTGTLVRILEAFEPPPQPIHVVHHEDRRGTAAMRQFIDTLDEELRKRRLNRAENLV